MEYWCVCARTKIAYTDLGYYIDNDIKNVS